MTAVVERVNIGVRTPPADPMIPFTEPADVSDKRGIPWRAAVRLLIVAPDDRLLLFRYQPPDGPPFWSTAQGPLPQAFGSIDDDVRAVIARTGLKARHGSSIDLRDEVYAAEDGALERWFVWTETVVSDGGEPGPDLWTREEREIVGEHRWWSLDELRATREAIHPAFLPDLLSRALTRLGRFIVVADGPMGDMRWYARMSPDHTSMGMIEVEPRDGGLGGLALVEHWAIAWSRRREPAFLSRPLRWAREHDVRNWRMFTARNGRRRIGGAVVAWDTPGLAPLQDRRDRALLWDIREGEAHDIGGVSEALFRAAAAWARARGCRWLISRSDPFDTWSFGFFLRCGCELGAIHRFVDPDDGGDFDRVRFLWYFDLGDDGELAVDEARPPSNRAAALPAVPGIAVDHLTVTDGTIGEMDDYARIPVAFEVRSVFEVEVRDRGRGGLLLHEREVDVPWVRDDDDGEHRVQRWARRFDQSNGRVFRAWSGEDLVGGAIVAFGAPGVHVPEGRQGLAVLWDIRVLPGARGRGVGQALFRAAETWARERGCRWLAIETESTNVGACRFCARMGAALGGIDRFVNPDIPGETQLLWYLDLAPERETESPDEAS